MTRAEMIDYICGNLGLNRYQARAMVTHPGDFRVLRATYPGGAPNPIIGAARTWGLGHLGRDVARDPRGPQVRHRGGVLMANQDCPRCAVNGDPREPRCTCPAACGEVFCGNYHPGPRPAGRPAAAPRRRVFAWVFAVVQGVFALWLAAAIAHYAAGHGSAVTWCRANPGAGPFARCVSDYTASYHASAAGALAAVIIVWAAADAIVAACWLVWRRPRPD